MRAGEERPVHGGDVDGFQLRYGTAPLDFSASISPLGLPGRVHRAAEEALGFADRYPDPLCRELRQRIAETEGVPAEQIVCGNGAVDLIYRIAAALRPRQALALAPTFSEYAGALALHGCIVRRHPLRAEDDFVVTETILDEIDAETTLVVLCQPNNPTGRTVEGRLGGKIAERAAQVGATLLIDECFLDFVDEPAATTWKPLLATQPQLLILRSFTKLYAMAGLRLGYCLCGSAALAERIAKAGAPWSVSAPAQAAGVAALADGTYRDRVRTLVRTERPHLAEALAECGFTVIPGEANFLLFHSERPLAEALARRGILIRDCAGFAGLTEGWYRVAVRAAGENVRLVAALREIVGETERSDA